MHFNDACPRNARGGGPTVHAARKPLCANVITFIGIFIDAIESGWMNGRTDRLDIVHRWYIREVEERRNGDVSRISLPLSLVSQQLSTVYNRDMKVQKVYSRMHTLYTSIYKWNVFLCISFAQYMHSYNNIYMNKGTLAFREGRKSSSIICMLIVYISSHSSCIFYMFKHLRAFFPFCTNIFQSKVIQRTRKQDFEILHTSLQFFVCWC